MRDPFDPERRPERVWVWLAVILVVSVAVVLLLPHHIHTEVEGRGSIELSDDSVRCYEVLRVEFVPDDGWHLSSVYVDGVEYEADDGVLEFSQIFYSHLIRAVFAADADVRTLTVVSNDGGTTDPSGTTTHTAGTVAVVSITPSEGYVVDDVLVDGVSVGSTNDVEVRMDADRTVEVVFRQATDADPWVNILVDVKVLSTGADYGTIVPSGLVRVAYGSSLTVRMYLNEGYSVVSVTVGDEYRGDPTVFTITDIVESVDVYIVLGHGASFVVDVSCSDGGWVSPEGRVAVAPGDDLAIRFSPSSGYGFSYIEVDGKRIYGDRSSYTLEDIRKDMRVYVRFSQDGGGSDDEDGSDDEESGSFDVFETGLEGTRVQDGYLKEFSDTQERRVSSGTSIFQMKGAAPGQDQTATLRMENNADETLTVVLTAEETDPAADNGALEDAMQVVIVCGSNTVSCTLREILDGGWRMDLGTMAAGGRQSMTVRMTLPQEAGNEVKDMKLAFEFVFSAYSGV